MGAADEKGPEPGGWELMRGLERVEAAMTALAGGVVTQATFEMYKAAQAEKETSQTGEINALKTELAESRKTKAQQWFAIGICLLGVVASGIVAIVISRAGL